MPGSPSRAPYRAAVPSRHRRYRPSSSRNPQRPASILEQIGDDPLLHVVVWNADRDRVKRLAALVRLESEQAVGRPYPDRAVAALAKHGDRHDQASVAGRRDRDEHRRPRRSSKRRRGLFLCEARRVEAHESSSGGDPVLAAAGFQKVGDISMRQALIDAEIGEGVAIEPREPAGSAEPEEPEGVPDDAIDGVMSEAVRRGVRLERQALGERVSWRNRQQCAEHDGAGERGQGDRNCLSVAHQLQGESR